MALSDRCQEAENWAIEALEDKEEPEKEQEPRILTLDELRQVEPGTVLWMDMRNYPDDETSRPPLSPKEFCRFSEIDDDEVILFGDGVEYAEQYGMDYTAQYGMGFILWTAKPSQEQRRAVKWE